METVKLADNFWLHEFIPASVYYQYVAFSQRFIDVRLPMLAQRLRNHYGKAITINNWNVGGNFYHRGFRPPDAIGANLSSHKRGTAIDFDIAGVTPQQFQADVKANPEKFQEMGITVLEIGNMTWNHASIEWYLSDDIKFFDIK